MKKTLLLILSIYILLNSEVKGENIDKLYDTYLESLFAFKFNYTRKILHTLKKEHYDEIKTKLAFADYYQLMYESSGEEEKYFVLCKKEANAVINQLSEKKDMTNEDVFHLISAKSMLLKIQFMKKQYLRAAGDMKNMIDHFEYAIENETDRRMRLIAGMYNFYIETAKEDYPIIYPLVMFYPSGNKIKGLRQITESAEVDESNISVRSRLYLARIYHRDVKNYEKSKYYFEKLLEKYPENLYWRYEYISALKFFKKSKDTENQKVILLRLVRESNHLTEEQRRFFSNV